MHMNKWKIGLTCLCLGLMVATASFCRMPAYASEAVTVDGQQEKGTASITLSYVNEDDSVERIDGVELGIYQVADLLISGNSAQYSPRPAFSGTGIDFNGLKESDSSKVASALAQAIQNQSPAQKQVSDAAGVATFGNLDPGVYLVIQMGASGKAQNYETMVPFLLMVPEKNDADGQNSWNYQVTAEPKTELVKKPQTVPPDAPDTPPSSDVPNPKKPVTSTRRVSSPESTVRTGDVRTGDLDEIYLWTGLLIVAGATLLIVLYKNKLNKE